MRNCFDVTYAKKILHLLQMMQTTRIQDPSFQTQHSGKCDLLIELLPQACRYAVLDIGQDQLKIVGEAANFDAFAKEDVLASFYYRKVKVAVHTNKFTYIPEELFETAHLASYGKFIQAKEDEDVLTQVIKAAKCVVVFAVEKAVLTAVHQGVHQPHFYHASSPLIEAACKFNKTEEGSTIALNFNADSFDATYIKEDKFQFHNSFPARTPDEFNYFLLQLLDTLKLDMEQTEWVLAGVEQKAWLERLSKYSTTQKKADKTTFIRVSETFSSLAPEQHYLLTALSLCE